MEFVCFSVCPASPACVYAGQVSAGLHLSAPRQDIPCPHFHRHSDCLLNHHVVHQEYRVHVHHIPAHGNARTIENVQTQTT